MFEGLISFIEQSLFSLINKITTEETDGMTQVRRIVTIMLLFAEKNPGMTRVLIGDALVNEDNRLQLRINQMLDRLESTIKQSFRIAQTQTSQAMDAESQANLMLCFVIGRWHQFAKSGYKRKPMEFIQQQLNYLNGAE
jgi:TetR/AcrR family transcriptional regulator